MNTGTKVFIVIAIVALLLGFYFISQANKPTSTSPKTPAEPTANIWTVIGGVMDILNQGPKGSIGTDISGQFVDADGYLVNKKGEYVDTSGVLLMTSDIMGPPMPPVKYTKLV